MSNFQSTKLIDLGSCAFRQYGAKHSHCQYIHGYQLKAKFWFGGSKLDEKNWLVDFGGLKELKDILEKQFDHTLCIAADDPCLDLFKSLENAGACVLRIMPNGVGIERTAEYCFNVASEWLSKHYGDRCWVDKVEVFEHERNTAIYIKPNLISYTDTVKSFTETKAISTEILPEVELSKTTVVAEEVKANPTYEVKPLPDIGPKPTQVGPGKVTTGWSNPFGGTSWGT